MLYLTCKPASHSILIPFCTVDPWVWSYHDFSFRSRNWVLSSLHWITSNGNYVIQRGMTEELQYCFCRLGKSYQHITNIQKYKILQKNKTYSIFTFFFAAHSFRLFALVCSLIAARVTCTRHRKFPKLSQQVREPKIEKNVVQQRRHGGIGLRYVRWRFSLYPSSRFSKFEVKQLL